MSVSNIESDVLWFFLDAVYLDSPSKRVIFPRVEVYCQIEVALGHEPPAQNQPSLPAQRGRHEDSSQPHVQGAPKEDRKGGHSPASPPVQTPESGARGVVESPRPTPAPPQPCPVMRPGPPTGPSDVCPMNLRPPNLKQGVKGSHELDLATDHGQGTKNLPVLLTSSSAADTHSSKAGSSMPATAPESLGHSGLLLRHSHAATAATVATAAPGLLPSSPSPPPALAPVEELGPEQPTGETPPALALRQAINDVGPRNTSWLD